MPPQKLGVETPCPTAMDVCSSIIEPATLAAVAFSIPSVNEMRLNKINVDFLFWNILPSSPICHIPVEYTSEKWEIGINFPLRKPLKTVCYTYPMSMVYFIPASQRKIA